ncbi:DUF1236 domain-containing protein [Pseudolabrys taiwanensis]|uniref:DUF1236 domain-containing protein n=1 Tax=Pseudolabrys taiwanensis TaxID=331696 RepID=A0A346A3D3_9HYPH|nr:DUF1236 domain-containing protein [Pseudolabrys taiwanensis]AXK83680.1 DUF1236 domain-containing protein [Pseudolabrys taiwanensis]
MSEQTSRSAAPKARRAVMAWSVAAAAVLGLGAAVWLGPQSTQTADHADLEPQQIEAVKDFATSAMRAGNPNFLVSMGATVPQSVALQDMPRALGDALPAYINDQYVVVANRFVIVARNTRRIVAIVPAG